ncbi:unnamed protein product [Owenia fusiformis]|uniref:Rab-GAP TBC domain-containing protein n=1 Tax=Owenia fusiformis TaxID=6347 RepID=A0A8S4NXS8_OWEFU|nr:unnamed protein product [Owenia fusiformis]
MDASSPQHSPKSPKFTKREDLVLLAKLEEANRALEIDEKSVSLSVPSDSPEVKGHSRQGSECSVLSGNSVSSHVSNLTFDEEITAENDSWVQWGRIVNDWESYSKKKYPQIKDLVRKGIPHHFRGIVWQLLCNAHNSEHKDKYAEYLKTPSPCEKMIRRDIARTYPDHDFFKDKDGLGQESLFNVMKAYSLIDREVGYCQGSGFIVGLLLMQMPEEETFSVFAKLMQEYKLREMFKPSMIELGLCMYQLEGLIQELLPDLSIHFQQQGFHTSMYASSWFLTLFTMSLPIAISCRIVDLFLIEGIEIIFRVAIALLQTSESELLGLDMEGMLRYFQKDIPAKFEADPEALLDVAHLIKYSIKKMKKLEKEYSSVKSKEQEEQVELRRLRTENKLLKQRIDNLERENQTLADRLIQAQVTQATMQEEKFALKRDISTSKQREVDLVGKLDLAEKDVERLNQRTTNLTMAEGQAGIMIQQLQEEIKQLKLQIDNNNGAMRELREKIREMEELNRRLQKEPTSEIQSLQEELIASKLREAEANLSMKELKQRVNELDQFWKKHMEATNSPDSKKLSKSQMQHIQDELMSVKLREAQALSEHKEMKQKVMELETQNHICMHQMRRMDDEKAALKVLIDESEKREKECLHMIKEMERKSTNVSSKKKEEDMMSRIKDAEHSQAIAEMRQRIAELEIENQELVTAGQLKSTDDGEDDMAGKIADLQEQVWDLKMSRKMQSVSMMRLANIGCDSESDTESLDATITESDKFRSFMTEQMNSLDMNLDGENELTNGIQSAVSRDDCSTRELITITDDDSSKTADSAFLGSANMDITATNTSSMSNFSSLSNTPDLVSCWSDDASSTSSDHKLPPPGGASIDSKKRSSLTQCNTANNNYKQNVPVTDAGSGPSIPKHSLGNKVEDSNLFSDINTGTLSNNTQANALQTSAHKDIEGSRQDLGDTKGSFSGAEGVEVLDQIVTQV